MAALTVKTAVQSGTNVNGVAADVGGDTFANTGREALLVRNGSGGSLNVTIATPGTVDGLALEERVVAVPAGATRLIGPFPPRIFNVGGQPGANASVTYSGVTSLTVEVIRVSE